MNSFAHKKGWTEDGLIKKYQTNLENRIEKCDQSLVCRDEELCKEVEVLLHNANAQKIHHLYGLDSLTVMEKSLHTIPYKTGQTGLERLSKAFEVLELAALNLYVYPWRSEYKTVKMFSGMFTHLIKPALTLQQAKELFGLLGYESLHLKEEEELVLNSKRLPADVLLCLACGFFTARVECQMLLCASGSMSKNVEWVVQLVKERQAGHNLQVALENTKRKSEAALNANLPEEIDPDLDLYTGETDDSNVASTSCSTYSSQKQSKEGGLNKHKKRSQSDNANNEDARRGKSHNTGPLESSAEDQPDPNAQRQPATKEICHCITPDVIRIYRCENCKDIHSSLCRHYLLCKIREHTLVEFSGNVEELYSMKKHFCMINSTSDSFLVCYNCQLIHDRNCNVIKVCQLKHLVQPTGQVQPPQGERVNAQKRHTCLSSGALEWLICHTCNIFHDFECPDWQNCLKEGHCIQHSQEMGDSKTPCSPIPFHHCYTANQPWPTILCLSCKVFHFANCVDGWECSRQHKIEKLATCIDCSSAVFTLCRYCGAVYCKECWFKSPLFCKCGKPFNSSTSV